MILAYIGIFFGVVIGTLLVGPMGGVMGAMGGAMAGMLWTSGREAFRGIPSDATLVREQHKLTCIPKGRVTTATFVRDANKGSWLDVERCSLCHPADEVRCGKRCLILLRDVGGRQMRRVHAEPAIARPA